MNKVLKKHYLLIIIIVIAIFFQFYNLHLPVMNTDEAEVYLASQSIFESGVPKGFYNIPFYENAYVYKSNSSMYEFAPTNYYKTDTVLRKGWLTYYITAFASLFGNNEFILRFPFALISIVATFFFFRLNKLLFNRRTAYIASFLFAVSPSLLFYGRMVRYYSPMILLIILSTYFLLKALHEDKQKYFIGTALALALLFYTNILIFVSLILVFLIYLFIIKTKIRKSIIQSIILLLILILPWAFTSGFLWNLAKEPKSIVSASFAFQSITAGINNQGLLNIILYVGIILLVANIFFRKNIKKTFIYWNNKKSSQLIFIYLIVMIILPWIIAPTSSFEEKLFLPLIPIALIVIARVFDSIMKLFKNKVFHYTIVLIILVLTFSSVTVLGDKGHNSLPVSQIFNLEKDLMYEHIEEIIQSQTDNNLLILTTSNQFPMMFYTNYSAQIVWPVRKEFINNYDEELVIIETRAVEGTCNFFYQYVNPVLWCNSNKNYLERIKDCKAFAVDEEIILYYCKANNNFIGGGQGLFFPDFPKGSPPDFIWDKEPFSVAIDVENHGESNVEKLKVIFTDDFAGREFDTEKKEFVFEKNIQKQERINGEIITSKEHFDLGNTTFNHKLAQRLRYVNASVKLCYPYTTAIRIDICEDSLNICSYDISGGPVQISSIKIHNLNLNFSTNNNAEGEIGKFDECGKENPTKKIGVLSEAFKCTTANMFACEGIYSMIKEGNSYTINIKYDYQQEFRKSILLRSTERNQHDYENYKEQ